MKHSVCLASLVLVLGSASLNLGVVFVRGRGDAMDAYTQLLNAVHLDMGEDSVSGMLHERLIQLEPIVAERRPSTPLEPPPVPLSLAVLPPSTRQLPLPAQPQRNGLGLNSLRPAWM